MELHPAILDPAEYARRLRQNHIAPYTVQESGLSLRTCIDNVNRNNFLGYGADYRHGSGASKIVVGCLQQYHHLIKSLAALKRIKFVPQCELGTTPFDDDQILCSIRHDVDADPRVSLAEAEIEAEFGARTTYFMLHTSAYYGVFENGVFHRNTCMASLYKEIQDLGQEIALHTDPLWIYQEHKIDGASAVIDEIQWLRAQGLNVCGTVAHNSAPVYGIENFAIFQGRNRRNLGPQASSNEQTPLLEEIVHEGKWAPLGVIDEAAIGLTYEGNMYFHQKDVPLEYGATRAVNRWRYDRHLGQLRNEPDPLEEQFIDQDRLIHDLAAMPGGRWLILSIHPLYYGARHHERTAPPMRVDSITIQEQNPMGWETYAPHTLQACSGEGRDPQVINFSDESGMLDGPRIAPGDARELRIMLLGGANLDGRRTAVPEHCGQQLTRLLQKQLDRPIWCRTLAFPGMGCCRHFAWFHSKLTEVSPHFVIIGVGADEIMTSLTPHWCIETGFDMQHPPGAYLVAQPDGVKIVERSPGAMIRRSQGRDVASPLSFADPHAKLPTNASKQIGACLDFYAEQVRAVSAQPLLLINECGESLGLWSQTIGHEQRTQAHAHASQVFESWAHQARVDLIDPYPSFIESELPTHSQDGETLSSTGHRLMARAVMQAMMQMEASAIAPSGSTA